MRIVEDSPGGTRVVAAERRLDSATAPAAEAALLSLMDAAARVVLDLSAVTYISSAGLRVLLLAARRARAGGGRFALAAPQPAVREVLDVSAFARIMPIHPTRAAAVASLG